MLAGALAYYAFFSVVPALLLFVSLLGVLVEDRALRVDLVESLVDRLDPIREVATAVIDGLADSGRTGTIIGILGLLWGASGFYGTLQGAMLRMFPGQRARDPLRTRLLGLAALSLILGAMLLTVVLAFGLPLLRRWAAARCAELDDVSLGIAPMVCGLDVAGLDLLGAVAIGVGVATLAALLVYVLVPPDGASIREASLPALLAGLIIGLLTSLFSWLAPVIVGQWLTLGVVGSVFIALVWFSLVFQVLLYGAAMARLRRDRARRRVGRPTL